LPTNGFLKSRNVVVRFINMALKTGNSFYIKTY